LSQFWLSEARFNLGKHQKTLSRTFSKKADAVAWARAKEAELDTAEPPRT